MFEGMNNNHSNNNNNIKAKDTESFIVFTSFPVTFIVILSDVLLQKCFRQPPEDLGALLMVFKKSLAEGCQLCHLFNLQRTSEFRSARGFAYGLRN